MIFAGPDKPSFYFANPANTTGANNGADAKARGWYAEGGWYHSQDEFRTRRPL